MISSFLPFTLKFLFKYSNNPNFLMSLLFLSLKTFFVKYSSAVIPKRYLCSLITSKLSTNFFLRYSLGISNIFSKLILNLETKGNDKEKFL